VTQSCIGLNANFKPAPSSELGLAGYLWDTFHTENEGGTWDGTITSEITKGGEYSTAVSPMGVADMKG
jgi:hypothetical protein